MKKIMESYAANRHDPEMPLIYFKVFKIDASTSKSFQETKNELFRGRDDAFVL